LQAVKPKTTEARRGAKKRRPPLEKLVVSKALSFERRGKESLEAIIMFYSI
jgi:hypothetical protein